MRLTNGISDRSGQNQRREPAESHFRKLDKTATSYVEQGSEIIGPMVHDSDEKISCRFDVYRADEVRMTSTQFGGGDWHWRLSDAEGLILLDTGGYATERECRGAIAILQENAGWASVSQNS
jgi:uncharacterized protein YegP (UPF0339 family)